MALLGLKMTLNHPKKVQIGYKLDQNTNLMNTFENNRQKCRKVKIQRNINDFHKEISLPGWKLWFVKNHEKCNNSSPDCPIWLIFYMLVLTTSRIGFGVNILIFSKKIADFQPKKPILTNFGWKSAIFCWKMKISKFLHQNLFY